MAALDDPDSRASRTVCSKFRPTRSIVRGPRVMEGLEELVSGDSPGGLASGIRRLSTHDALRLGHSPLSRSCHGLTIESHPQALQFQFLGPKMAGRFRELSSLRRVGASHGQFVSPRADFGRSTVSTIRNTIHRTGEACRRHVIRGLPRTDRRTRHSRRPASFCCRYACRVCFWDF